MIPGSHPQSSQISQIAMTEWNVPHCGLKGVFVVIVCLRYLRNPWTVTDDWRHCEENQADRSYHRDRRDRSDQELAGSDPTPVPSMLRPSPNDQARTGGRDGFGKRESGLSMGRGRANPQR